MQHSVMGHSIQQIILYHHQVTLYGVIELIRSFRSIIMCKIILISRYPIIDLFYIILIYKYLFQEINTQKLLKYSCEQKEINKVSTIRLNDEWKSDQKVLGGERVLQRKFDYDSGFWLILFCHPSILYISKNVHK